MLKIQVQLSVLVVEFLYNCWLYRLFQKITQSVGKRSGLSFGNNHLFLEELMLLYLQLPKLEESESKRLLLQPLLTRAIRCWTDRCQKRCGERIYLRQFRPKTSLLFRRKRYKVCSK